MHDRYKKDEKDQQASYSSDKFYREKLQVILIDNIEIESLCKNFNKYVDEKKNESF